jgi:hypothetical protein
MRTAQRALPYIGCTASPLGKTDAHATPARFRPCRADPGAGPLRVTQGVNRAYDHVVDGFDELQRQVLSRL